MVAVAERKSLGGFGPRLRKMREAAGLTQAELGERIGTPYQNIARLERGDREPSWGTLLKLADALGAKLDDFRDADQLSSDDTPDDPDPNLRPMGKRK